MGRGWVETGGGIAVGVDLGPVLWRGRMGGWFVLCCDGSRLIGTGVLVEVFCVGG